MSATDGDRPGMPPPVVAAEVVGAPCSGIGAGLPQRLSLLFVPTSSLASTSSSASAVQPLAWVPPCAAAGELPGLGERSHPLVGRKARNASTASTASTAAQEGWRKSQGRCLASTYGGGGRHRQRLAAGRASLAGGY